MDGPTLPEIVLAVDYGQRWPLSDIMWPGKRPDWAKLLPAKLIARLEKWAAFFIEHGDHETGALGGEENRKSFDLEGVCCRFG